MRVHFNVAMIIHYEKGDEKHTQRLTRALFNETKQVKKKKGKRIELFD